MPNPRGVNQYSKGGGGRSKGPPKLKLSPKASAAYTKAVNKGPRPKAATNRAITNAARRQQGLKRI